MNSEYRGLETEQFVPENTLTPEQEAELRAHVPECEIHYLRCGDCKTLYDNIGYAEYSKIIKALRTEDVVDPNL